MESRFATPSIKAQSGVMLIEALIAILIFSIGALGIIGLQSTATKVSGDARYRSEAALLANELLGRMWAADRTPANLRAAFDSSVGTNGGPAFQAWAWVGSNTAAPGTTSNPGQGTVFKLLPGASTNVPVVTVTPVSRTFTTAAGATATVTTAQVSIRVMWQAPQESGDSAVHSYDLVAQIGG